MIGFLKYFPLALRQASFTSETRISFSEKKRSVSLEVFGSTITFNVPMGALDNKSPFIHRKKIINKNEVRYESMNSRHPRHWVAGVFFRREWSYWRAWFGGRSATSALSVFFLSREEEHAFQDLSFFNAKALEYAIVSYLNGQYGFEGYDEMNIPQAPLNWEVKKDFSLINGRFFVDGGDQSTHFIFPIKDDLLVHFKFHYYGFVSKYPAREQMLQLSKEILDSVQIELSPETKKRYEEVQKESDYAKMTETFEPLKWPMKFEDID